MPLTSRRPGDRRSRSEFFWAASFFMDHYKLVIAIGAFLGALGFGYWTPKHILDSLQAQIIVNRDSGKVHLDTIDVRVNRRIDKLDDSYQMLNENMRILIRRLCVDKTFSSRDRALTGLTDEKCR